MYDEELTLADVMEAVDEYLTEKSHMVNGKKVRGTAARIGRVDGNLFNIEPTLDAREIEKNTKNIARLKKDIKKDEVKAKSFEDKAAMYDMRAKKKDNIVQKKSSAGRNPVTRFINKKIADNAARDRDSQIKKRDLELHDANVTRKWNDHRKDAIKENLRSARVAKRNLLDYGNGKDVYS